MKSTGIVRKMDKLGRIVLPVELRKSLKIDLNTPLEMFVDGDYILLKKFLRICFSFHHNLFDKLLSKSLHAIFEIFQSF